MAKVSVIIPSRNERFLARTVADVCAHATGDVEIIVIADAYWPDPLPPEDPRVIILHHGTALGMRGGINAGVRIATGDYLMKLDAHCSVAMGFDEVLAAECAEDWLVVPRRLPLDGETWGLQSRDDDKYPIDYEFLSYGFQKWPDENSGLHGEPWRARRAARAEMLVDEDPSFQGSCWFMSRKHWDRVIGQMDDVNYGAFIYEPQELGLKTWLSGGSVMVNKKTHYAHLYKGKQYGRGWSKDGARIREGRLFGIDFWMHDRWSEATRSLSWLVEHFQMPTWPDWDTVERHKREYLRDPELLSAVS